MPRPGDLRAGLRLSDVTPTPSSRRGRTRADRLWLVDLWLVQALSTRAQPRPLRVVDLGYGDIPRTTLGLHGRLREAGLAVRTTGVEREPARVRAAEPHARDGLRFVRGDFDLTACGLAGAHVVRAMNVLRAYDLARVRTALAEMGRALAEQGLLVEGTTDTEGHVATAHLFRRNGSRLVYEGLLMATDGSRGFAPWLFRDYLPRDLRRHVRAGEPVHELLRDWHACWLGTRSESPRDSFSSSLRALAAARDDVPFDPWLAERGVARWCPARPSARPEVFDGRLGAAGNTVRKVEFSS